MRTSSWTPSIVPNGHDRNVYLVIDGFERGEFLYRETRLDQTNFETTITDLLTGQYNNPQSVVSFNTEEKWAQDVSEDVAREIQNRCDTSFEDVPHFLEDFVAKYLGYRDRQLALKLA